MATSNGNNGIYKDVVVVGAGVIGTASTYALSTLAPSSSVSLLDQFDTGHSKGSSHGHTRIIRKAYSKPHFVKMATLAYDKWKELEVQFGRRLTYQVGGIEFGLYDPNLLQNDVPSSPAAPFMNRLKQLRSSGVEHTLLSAADSRVSYPQLRLPENYRAITQPDAGIVLANKAVNAMQSVACRNNNVSINDNMKVSKVVCSGSQIAVHTTCNNSGIAALSSGHNEDKIFYTKNLIVTPGAWLPSFASKHFNLDLDINIIKVGYWYYQSTQDGMYDADKFPVWIALSEPHFYGTPAFEYKNLLKVGAHYQYYNTHPDIRTFSPDEQLKRDTQDFVRKHFPYCDPNPVLAESCLYSMTRGEEFILDRVNQVSPHVIIGGGGSGHAFKHAPMFGDILARLATSSIPSSELSGSTEIGGLDISTFAIHNHLKTKAKM